MWVGRGRSTFARAKAESAKLGNNASRKPMGSSASSKSGGGGALQRSSSDGDVIIGTWVAIPLRIL